MKKQEYLVQISIVEVRDITAKDSSGTSDPFARITVGNLPPQVTTAKEKTTTAVFNQNFTFSNLQMSDVDFENFEAKIELFDQNQFFQNELIGVHSIGLATLYRNPQHEIFNKWLPLSNPKDIKQVQGYILVSAYIIGQHDAPPVHDANENAVEDEPDEFGGVPDDQLDGEQLERRRAKQKQLAIVTKPTPYSKQAQLMVNLVKAEDLPILNGSSVDSFISVRVNGITQITNVIKNQQKPQYRVRMMFPITFPLNNDKIIIRVWDKRVCMSDTFIGQIPEFPQENDFFNITYLQSKGGVLPYRWFSLYGIPKSERPNTYESNVLGYKKNPSGTCYYGRVLLSLNLTPSEKPEKIVQPLGIYREPQIEKYTIRMDTYELNQGKGLGQNVTIRIRCGPAYLDSAPGIKKEGYYQWRQKEVVVTKEVEVPKNLEEQTDLIVEVLNEDKKRKGYVRINTLNAELGHDKPIWYEIKDLYSRGDDETVFCYVLMNIMFRQTSIIESIPRQLVKRNAILPYICRCYLYAGYDFCPDKLSEELELKYELRIGDKQFKQEKPIKSKNPIWNQKIEMCVKMEQNLEFVSNIILTFNNNNNSIGQANVTTLNCKCSETEEPEPIYQYYHVMHEGKQIGRILLGMTLQRLQKNAKINNDTTVTTIFESFNTYRILFPVYAIRLLPKKLKQSLIKVRISIPFNENEAEPYKGVKASSFLPGGEEETIHSQGQTDPNFLELITIDCRLPEDPFFCPQLEVELTSKLSISQKYYTSIPLFRYYPNIKESLARQIEAHFIASQNQSYSAPFEYKKEADELEIEVEEEDEEQNQQEEQQQQQEQTVFSKKPNQSSNKVSFNKENIQQQDNNKQTNKKLSSNKQFNISKPKQQVYQKIYEQMRYKGIENVYVQEDIDLELTVDDLKEEVLDKKQKSKKLEYLLKHLPKEWNTELNKTYLKKEILNYKVFQPQMLEPYFTNVLIDNSDDGIDYGRPVIKGAYELEILKTLPYQRIKIYELSKKGAGIGLTTSAILKADIKILIEQPTKTIKTSSKPKMTKNVQQQQEYLRTLRNKGYPFDFFDSVFHEYLKSKEFRCKVRVYIYRGLGLAAQGQNIDTYHYMAGEQSKNSANPYLEVEVGEPGADPGDYVKKVSDPDRFIENTLSPTFMRSFELDAILPQDSYLHVRVFNKGMLNSLIGAVKIDIEDRLMGEKKLKTRLSCQAYMDYFEQMLDNLKYAENADNLKNELQAEIANLIQRIESFSSDFIIPVEYQQLKHPDKLVSQGQLEMFVEVLPLEIARQLPPAKMIEKVSQEYEVRLIIYETFKIPINPVKKCVDIYVRCAIDSSATGTGSEIVKETDTHLGSEDGDGEFNWRMKFPFRTPCQFPRLKLSVHDFSTFGASPSVCEATISLKRVLSVMKTQSVYEMEPTQLKLYSPSAPGQDKGTVLVQMTILQKAIAEGKPVGEAQEEPNIDPFLKKPTEGRGLGAFFKGIGFPWKMVLTQVCMILAPMIISALVSFILFVKPGILMPKP